MCYTYTTPRFAKTFNQAAVLVSMKQHGTRFNNGQRFSVRKNRRSAFWVFPHTIEFVVNQSGMMRERRELLGQEHIPRNAPRKLPEALCVVAHPARVNAHTAVVRARRRNHLIQHERFFSRKIFILYLVQPIRCQRNGVRLHPEPRNIKLVGNGLHALMPHDVGDGRVGRFRIANLESSDMVKMRLEDFVNRVWRGVFVKC